MKKAELGQLICYLWSNIDQAPCSDEVEKAFVNCPVRIQKELLECFTKQANDYSGDWIDKPENVRKAIKQAEKILR